MATTIFTQRKRPDFKPVPLDQEDRTERTGYRSARQQIKAIELAGQRLQAYRQSKYWGSGMDPQGESTGRHYGELDPTIATAKIDRARTVHADLVAKTKNKKEAEEQAILDKAKAQLQQEQASKKPADDPQK